MGKGRIITKTGFNGIQSEVRRAKNGAVFVVLKHNRIHVIVAKDGYEHKWWSTNPDNRYNNSTDKNVHVSMCGAQRFTFDEFWAFMNEIREAITDAQKFIYDYDYELIEVISEHRIPPQVYEWGI